MAARKLTEDEIINKYFPRGHTKEIWRCGSNLYERTNPQPYVPSSSCPFCYSDLDSELREVFGKAPGYVLIFTKCTRDVVTNKKNTF